MLQTIDDNEPFATKLRMIMMIMRTGKTISCKTVSFKTISLKTISFKTISFKDCFF